MALALHAGDFDQHLFVDDGRAAQQRTRDRDFVLMGELADQGARRVGEQRKPFGEIGARREFGMRDQAGQHAVEQIDVIGAEIRSALQEQLADPARGIGAAFGIVASDDFVESGDQRCRWRHEAFPNRPYWRVFRQSRRPS